MGLVVGGIDVKRERSGFVFDGPATARLAHGAGAGMDSTFLAAMAEGLAGRGFRVARFEFPYMAARRTGKKRPPDREPVLRDAWLRVVAGPALMACSSAASRWAAGSRSLSTGDKRG
jgi:predicted alpha/beta-hydrolase family hydrolase